MVRKALIASSLAVILASGLTIYNNNTSTRQQLEEERTERTQRRNRRTVPYQNKNNHFRPLKEKGINTGIGVDIGREHFLPLPNFSLWDKLSKELGREDYAFHPGRGTEVEATDFETDFEELYGTMDGD